jgi:hypothetical protein
VVEQSLALTPSGRASKVTGATLAIAKLDRLSRNAAFLLMLRDSGVRFVPVDMPEANDLTFVIMALAAQQQREATSLRTKGALAVATAVRTLGLIVDVLVESGHPVVPIHPNAVKAARPRYRSSGAMDSTDDRGDTYLLADVLSTDGDRCRLANRRSLRPDPRLARALPWSRRPGGGPRCARQPAASLGLLGRRPGDVRRHRQPDRARLPRALSDARERRPPHPPPARRAQLLRRQLPRASDPAKPAAVAAIS